MIEASLDTVKSLLYIRPKAALAKADFMGLSEKVDPFIEASGGLRGLIIEAPAFPGWESFGALVAHVRFVRDHHRLIEKVAVVTDSTLGDLAQYLASHFVSAQIRHFPAGQLEAAKEWVTSPS